MSTIMKQTPSSPLRQSKLKQLLPLLWFFVAMLTALLGGILLWVSANDIVTIQIISTGFDTLRSQLIAALLLTAGAALIGAMLTKRKLGALVGASLAFCGYYLLPFIQVQLQPVYDAGHHLRPLDQAALIHTSMIMAALGILSAFIGSAVGTALYEAVLEQPFILLGAVWQRITAQRKQDIADRTTHSVAVPRKAAVVRSTGRWLGLACLILLAFFAAQSTDIFVLSPDTNIHQAPKTGTISGVAALGTLEKVTMISHVLGNKLRSFMLYLPPTYKVSKKRYPTLYLLHGSPGTITDWINGGKAAESANTLIGLQQTRELIMVFPDGNGAGRLVPSEWGNSGNHAQLMETYVASELVKYVDQHYRTIPSADYRAIGGLSMGGFGAANIGIHHPDVFGSVIALGGYYTAFVEPNHIWGNDASYRFYNSPLYEIRTNEQAAKLHFFLGAATQDQPYYEYTLQFASQLKHLDIPYTLTLEAGHHAWKVWADQLYRALLWIKWGPTHQPPHVLSS